MMIQMVIWRVILVKAACAPVRRAIKRIPECCKWICFFLGHWVCTGRNQHDYRNNKYKFQTDIHYHSPLSQLVIHQLNQYLSQFKSIGTYRLFQFIPNRCDRSGHDWDY